MSQSYRKKSNKKQRKNNETVVQQTVKSIGKTIQWFPGHMAKAKREIEQSLRYVDIAIEICDARAPKSSRNPNVDEILKGKPSLLLMNKSSLSDPWANSQWQEYYRSIGQNVLFTDCITGMGIKSIIPSVRNILKEKLESFERKGMSGRVPRAMIIGITNSGKSTLINKLCGNTKAEVQDRPGITRKQQWVTSSAGIELLDTPGLLWPKFEEEKTGFALAYIGSIRDEILETEEIAIRLCEHLSKTYPSFLAERYKLKQEDFIHLQPHEIFEQIGRNRGFLMSGGEIDYARCAAIILDEFRGGKIGKITLELPPGSDFKYRFESAEMPRKE